MPRLYGELYTTFVMSKQPNGILTKADREFLSAEGEYYTGDHARQTRYQRRRDIRRRIVESILDFSFIASHLEEEERRKIFENPSKHGSGDEFDFEAGVGSLLAWLHRGYREQGRDLLDVTKYYLEEAEREYRVVRTGNDGKAEFSHEMDWTSIQDNANELARKLEEGEPVLVESILKIPTLRNFDVNVDAIDSVSLFVTNPGSDFSGMKTITQTILEEELDLKVPIQVHGVERVTLTPSHYKDDDDETGDEVPKLSSNKRWNADSSQDILDKVDESLGIDWEDGESDEWDAE